MSNAQKMQFLWQSYASLEQAVTALTSRTNLACQTMPENVRPRFALDDLMGFRRSIRQARARLNQWMQQNDQKLPEDALEAWFAANLDDTIAGSELIGQLVVLYTDKIREIREESPLLSDADRAVIRETLNIFEGVKDDLDNNHEIIVDTLQSNLDVAWDAYDAACSDSQV